MTNYTLSNKAVKDLENIYDYTVKEFGRDQAARYLSGIGDCLSEISQQPMLSPSIEDIKRDYRRHVYGKHHIYFLTRKNDIFVVRILHQKMKYEFHLTS